MRAARSVLLAVLIVAASVVGSVGVMGQTATDSGPVEYEFTGSPETLVVDTSALDGGTEFTVEYTTQGGPSTGTTVLARETYNTANLDGDELWFLNEGAYESVNVTVSGYSGGEPAFESRGIADSLNLKKTIVGSTGGDSDLTCDVSERLGTMTGGYKYLDCTAQPGSTAVNTTGLDATQTKIDFYQSSLNSNAQTDNYQTSLDNYLSDTKTQARIIGKNAYIKSLNNGSSKATAKAEAKGAVADYYATKQRNLANEWNIAVQDWDTNYQTLVSESGVTADNMFYPNLLPREDDNEFGYEYSGTAGTETLTLVNSDTVTTDKYEIQLTQSTTSNTKMLTFGLQTGSIRGQDPDSTLNKYEVAGIMVEPPNDNYQRSMVLNSSRFASQWSEIESQNTQVQNNMDTLAENTYSAYQNGEINSSDLVDPYVLANQQSAGSDFQGWTAAQLTLLGTNSPENFDQIGSFNLTTGSGTQYEGVLFSQENPTSGQFENGTTYDTSNIGGTQYVVTSNEIVELSGTFTIDRITTQDGQTTENVTVQKTQYQTTNTTELKQLYEDLAYERAQIEAREQALAGGGGFSFGGESGTIAIVAVAGAAFLLLKD